MAAPDVHGQLGRPLVSVVIPCHNYARFLPQCLESLLNQGLDPAELEVVFVDDESSDGSLALARGLLGRMPFGSWQTLALRRVGRPGPVRNAGLALARGGHLLCLDPDDQLLPGFLPRCLAALAGGRAEVAYSGYFEEQDGQRREVIPPDYRPLLLASQNILHSAALLRREVWERGARYRSASAYEDWDFWIQAALLGARFARVGAPLFAYRLHGQGYSRQARSQDGAAKARIVLDNPAFFPPWTRAWARGLLRGEAWAKPQGRGVIPVLREHIALPGRQGAAACPGPHGGNPLPSGAAARAGGE
ncbi:MAG: glycosyltransferase family 2 protein [Humidesulfovibrio sp.]|nr:glycosyltransferase family 2 protein [Humidesulfovibrio sp.]